MNKNKKSSFWRRLRIAVKDIDNYSELAAEPLRKSIQYFFMLICTLSLVLAIITTPKYIKNIKDSLQYITENAADFSIKDGQLQTDIEIPTIIENEQLLSGKVIVDDETDTEEAMKKYEEEFSKDSQIVLVLKDKLYVKNKEFNLNEQYTYNQLLEQFKLEELNKESLEDLKSSVVMNTLSVSYFLMTFIVLFGNLFFEIGTYILLLSLLTFSTSRLINVRLKYDALFKISIYSVSLSTILYMLYLLINIFRPFVISNFELIYFVLAYIYIIAALFMIKADIIKHHMELSRIVEEQAKVREEIKEKEEDKKEKKDDNKNEKNKSKKKEKGKEESDLNKGEMPEPGQAIKERENLN